MPEFDSVLDFVGRIIAYGGGAAAVAYFLFQHLGKRWIENKFAERLESYKHQQTVELSRLRIEIDSLLSGALKLQEREFQILPEAWERLDIAHGLVSWATSPGQETANVNHMTDKQLDEFLAKLELTETHKEELRSSSNRGKTYEEISYWYRIGKAKKAIADLEQFVARNGIFFPHELKDKFTSITKIFWSALISHEVGREPRDRTMQAEGWKRMKEEADPLYESIGADIQVRLRSHGPTL